MFSLSQASAASFSESVADGAKAKLYFDPVHGQIELDPAALEVIDTPEFQRLRDLKQLGASYLVFGGASHNRFEHSIGVYYLARELISRYQVTQPELEITRDEVQGIALGGLCHDLGHGPFSHVWDNLFIPTVCPDADFSHEQMSLDLLDVLIEDNAVDSFDADTVELAKATIVGHRRRGHSDPSRQFLYEVVSNSRNSIDVDKFDYLARDSRCIGMKSMYDCSRLMHNSRVIDGEICYLAKEVYNVYELFHTRYSLFKQVYTHRAGKAIEFMLTDAFVEANAAWDGRLSSAIGDPREFRDLSDCILKEIEVSRDPALDRAQSIIRQVRRRQLYRFVDEFILPDDVARHLRKVTAEDITSHRRAGEVAIDVKDVIVQDMKLNFGNKDQDPVSLTKFFRHTTDTSSFRISRNRVSYCITGNFQERILRVYSRPDASDVMRSIQRAFRQFLRQVVSKTDATNSHRREEDVAPDTRPVPTSRLFHSPGRKRLGGSISLTAPAVSSAASRSTDDVHHDGRAEAFSEDEAEAEEPPRKRSKHALKIPPRPMPLSQDSSAAKKPQPPSQSRQRSKQSKLSFARSQE